MDKTKEIETAFLLWKKLREMEYHLRGLYGHEFLKLVQVAPSLLPPGVLKDELIPF